ncbi:hypothetical protein [Paenibacillus sp.]|uniref:hypothetical protein n=1 Tax=Paenibacillus sp. TaxID=58172 RepID=UPI00356820A0
MPLGTQSKKKARPQGSGCLERQTRSQEGLVDGQGHSHGLQRDAFAAASLRLGSRRRHVGPLLAIRPPSALRTPAASG